MQIGENIARLRLNCNMSQSDLADALQVSRQSVSKWETGAAVPELEKLIAISDLFSVSLDELIRGIPENSTDSVNSRDSADSAEATQQAPKQKQQPGELQQYAGYTLLGIGLLCFILCKLDWELKYYAVYLTFPFVLCGVLCFLVRPVTVLRAAWISFFIIDVFFMRFATVLTWREVLYTFSYTPEMNYVRLILGWCEFLIFIFLVIASLCVYCGNPLPHEKKEVIRFGCATLISLLMAFPLYSLLYRLPIWETAPYLLDRILFGLYDWACLLFLAMFLVKTNRAKD